MALYGDGLYGVGTPMTDAGHHSTNPTTGA